MNLDTLVEVAAVQGEVAAGLPLRWLLAQYGGRLVAIGGGREETVGKSPTWTAAEDEFVKEHLGWLTDEEMGEALGRPANGVHLRWARELGLPAPSKNPDVYTAGQAAKILGMDGHPMIRLIDEGILPGRRLPGERNIRVVRRVTLWRWAVNPMNWIYFKPWKGRLGHWRLARLLALKAQRWGDEWWPPGQVAAYHGVHHTDVNRYIHAGKLRGKKYGNWWILRSDATAAGLVFYKGSGCGPNVEWSEAGDRFLLRAWREGFSCSAIGRMMKWPEKRVQYRLGVLAPRRNRDSGATV